MKRRRAEHISVGSRLGKLRHEHRAENVSIAAATAINLSGTQHHDHAVPVEVSIQRQLAGYDQRALTRGVSWSKYKIAIHKSEYAIGIARAQPGNAIDRVRSVRDITALIYRRI